MKMNRLNKDAVRSTEKLDRKVTTLPDEELEAVTGGIVPADCNCNYKYGSCGIAADGV